MEHFLGSVFLICAFVSGVFAQYYGTEVGQLSMNDHDVEGTMYIVDENTLFIKDFSYDGEGPDAYFWIGTTSTPDASGTIVPDESGRSDVLGEYRNRDIYLTLPASVDINNVKWFSVWCEDFGVNFGHVIFAADLVVPAPQDIGSLTHRTHDARSGTITILNHKQMRIVDLEYDGRGPDAFFLVGTGSPNGAGDKVADETGSTDILKEYNKKTVVLTLPDGITMFDIDWFSLYCIQFTENFADITIPDSLTVPPYMEIADTSDLENCEQMHEFLNVAWTVHDTYIEVEMQGALLDDEWMAFGVSGSSDRTYMLNADVTVAYFDSSGANAIDYTLTQYSLCSNGRGACPDTDNDGTDDAEVVTGSRDNGVVTVRFTRPLTTGDAGLDKPISTDEDEDTYIAWAIGQLNSQRMVTKHHTIPTGNVQLNFGRTPAKNCPALGQREQMMYDAWGTNYISGEDVQVFTARMGPTGGERGYKAITNEQPWGIAWYLNGYLIPELQLKRGVTYTFMVEGGEDTSNTAKYHPLYITDDPKGGYALKSNAEKQQVRTYAGVKLNGDPTEDAVGRYCEWTPKTTDQWRVSETFEDYKETLKEECEAGEAGSLTWTPNSNTPDLVYYQCHTHNFLGWKIHVVDEYTEWPPMAGSLANTPTFFTHVISIVCSSFVILRK